MQKTLRELRREAGYETQEKFAMKIGVPRPTVTKWETGVRRPDLAMIPKIAETLNSTSDEVIAAIAETRKIAKQIASTA